MCLHRIHYLSTALAALVASLALVSSSSAAVWMPPGTSIYDGASSFVLLRTAGTGAISYVECQSTVTGKTPGTANGSLKGSELAATFQLSNCYGAGVPVSVSAPTGPIELIARKPTWSPKYGPTSGGGDVRIPPKTTYDLKIKFGGPLFGLDCTLHVNKESHTFWENGFSLAPDFSSLYPPEWAINKVPVGVQVSGPTASKCAQSAKWVIDTYHPGTNPHLQIHP